MTITAELILALASFVTAALVGLSQWRTNRFTARKDEVALLREEVTRLHERLEVAEQENAELRKRVFILENENSEMRARVTELEHENAHLRQISATNNSK